MEKTIKALVPPPEGTKRPGIIEFTDGAKVKYWPNQKYGAPLEVGATAKALISEKDGQYGTEYMLREWGESQPKGRPMMGRQISPEERRSIAAQACIKAACELYHGTGQLKEAGIAAESFMKLHDKIVRNGEALNG